MVEEKVILQVEGMTCSNCAQTITHRLEKKGLKDFWVNFEKGEVELEDLHELTVSNIINEINGLGYKATEKATITDSGQSRFSTLEKRFIIAAAFTLPLFLHMLVNWHWLHNGWVQMLLCLPVLYIGLNFFGKSAWGAIKHGQTNMDVLITIGALSAFIYSLSGLLIAKDAADAQQYLFFETAAVIITLVLLGNIIEQRSLKKTSSAVESLLQLQPVRATRILNAMTNEEITENIDVGLLKKNDLLLINSGEKIAADGRIYWGEAIIDESSMTGESIPSDKKVNDNVLAGTVIQSGSIKIIADAVGSNTLLNNIIEIVRKATQNKPAIQKLGDKLSAWFVPVVLVIAVLTFILSHFVFGVDLTASVLRSIAVMLISCPCAMGLATPTAVAVAVGRAAQEGLLIKGGHLLELFSQSKTIVFDKTGTLTEPQLNIKEIKYYKDKDLAKNIIFTLEQYSTHPMAKTLTMAVSTEKPAETMHFSSVSEEKGNGVKATDKDGNNYFIGNYFWAKEITSDDKHQVYVVKNKELMATADFEETIRNDAAETIRYFKSQGYKTVLLSGDRFDKCKHVADVLGMDTMHAEKLPTEKLAIITELKKIGPVIMVGDGINDSPSLATADIGVSFGSATQTAIKTAGIILMNEQKLASLIKVHQLSKATLTTIKQNLFWALIYNVVAIPIASIGLLSPMVSSFSMAFSDVVVIGNSLRLKIKNIFTVQSSAV